MNKLRILEAIQKDIALVDYEIAKICSTRQQLLAEAAAGLMSSGGKRLRPALVLLCSKFGRPEDDGVIPVAAAIELIHAATLVHDDIIDEAKLRRGSETIQHRWGKDTAVFAGDFLFAKAFSILAQKVNSSVLELIAQVIIKVCEGEVDQYQNRYNLGAGLKQYLKRVKKKTALLFALSCEIGALMSGVKPPLVRLLNSYGMNLGMAFQVTDDVMDIVATEQEMGKPPGSDILEGIYTLPVIYALNCSPDRDRLRQLLSQNTGRSGIEEALQIVLRSGGIEYSIEMAELYLKKAEMSIGRIPLNESTRCLKEITDFVRHRRF